MTQTLPWAVFFYKESAVSISDANFLKSIEKHNFQMKDSLKRDIITYLTMFILS